MAALKCARCRRNYHGRGDWNVTMKSGVAVGLLCPKCQTPEENAEAEINAATIEYSKDAFGLAIGKAKV